MQLAESSGPQVVNSDLSTSPVCVANEFEDMNNMEMQARSKTVNIDSSVDGQNRGELEAFAANSHDQIPAEHQNLASYTGCSCEWLQQTNTDFICECQQLQELEVQRQVFDVE